MLLFKSHEMKMEPLKQMQLIMKQVINTLNQPSNDCMKTPVTEIEKNTLQNS